jgi:hypothetical protein
MAGKSEGIDIFISASKLGRSKKILKKWNDLSKLS